MRREREDGDKTEYARERLDTTPRLVSESFEETTRIDFGNSGLTLWLDRNESGKYGGSFDFMPEGRDQRPKDNLVAKKYARMFTCSMYALYQFLNDPKTKEKFRLDPEKIESVGASSNKVFTNFVSNLFNNHGGEGLIKTEPSGEPESEEIKLDIVALKKLPANNLLINYLRTVAKSENSKRITVLHTAS